MSADAIVYIRIYVIKVALNNMFREETYLRVYSVRKDSKNGCSSCGVAANAVLINSSRTSFCGFEKSTDMVSICVPSSTARFHFDNDVTRRL